ncbi:hypothetical protein A2Y99_01005, partial [Candidatus Gottesmanbacteria bacterium RBG_13_37_7]
NLSPDMVVNLVCSVHGIEYLAAMIPAILDTYQIPYSGAGFSGESMAYNKYSVKKLLENVNVPTPKSQLVYSPKDEIRKVFNFPLIVKLNEIHGSVELDSGAICHNEMELHKRISFLYETYHQSILLEEFIIGREFSVFVFENLGPEIFTVENKFSSSNDYSLASFDLQWGQEKLDNVKYQDPVINQLVKKAYLATGMRDYGKFDIRQDKSGTYYFIDSNTNPVFGPHEIECPLTDTLQLYGYSFEAVLTKLLENVSERGYNTLF